MHSPAQRHHSLIAGHPPACGQKRAHNMIEESDNWTVTSDSLNFDFDEDFLKELDISNIEFTPSIKSKHYHQLDAARPVGSLYLWWFQ